MSEMRVGHVIRSTEKLAGLIDRELADIASHLPEGIMTSSLGIYVDHEIHRVEDVGSLHAAYLGGLTGREQLGQLFNEESPYDRYNGILIIAKDSRETEFIGQKFALDYWYRAQVITPITAEEAADSRKEFPALPFVLSALHRTYMQRVLGDSNVVSLTQRAADR